LKTNSKTIKISPNTQKLNIRRNWLMKNKKTTVTYAIGSKNLSVNYANRLRTVKILRTSKMKFHLISCM
jgi:hypothetical protein